MEHIIVSKVNLPRKLDSYNHVRPAPWRKPQWNERRIELLNKYTRSSLRKQTTQNFTFVSLWGGHHRADRNNMLDNEIALIVEEGRDALDEQTFPFEEYADWDGSYPLPKTEEDFYYQIRHLLRKHFDAPILITDLDSDDCLRHDFCQKLQQEAAKHLSRGCDILLDVEKRYLMHVETKGTGQKKRSTPSPIVSSLELNEVQGWCMKHPHSLLNEFLPPHISYKKVPGLLAMQTVGDTNILTQGIGEKVPFNPKNYF